MNTKRGAINFEVGGASYTARLSTNAMIRYQDEANETVIEAFTTLQDGKPDMRRLRDIMWVSLDGEHSKDDIGELMDELGIEEVSRIISEAAVAAFPQAEKGAEAGNATAGKKKPRQNKS